MKQGTKAVIVLGHNNHQFDTGTEVTYTGKEILGMYIFEDDQGRSQMLETQDFEVVENQFNSHRLTVGDIGIVIESDNEHSDESHSFEIGEKVEILVDEMDSQPYRCKRVGDSEEPMCPWLFEDQIRPL